MSEKLDRLNLSNVGGFLNSLNAKEGHYRHLGNKELEADFSRAQKIIWQLLGEVEAYRLQEDRKKENQLYCIGCDTQLEWGGFAYDQKMCWDCFEEKINFIISNTTVDEGKDILKFMAAITTYTFIPRRKEEF